MALKRFSTIMSRNASQYARSRAVGTCWSSAELGRYVSQGRLNLIARNSSCGFCSVALTFASGVPLRTASASASAP